VTHDLLGLYDKFTPKFVKQYATLHTVIHQALLDYGQEVKERTFPADEHTYSIPEEEWEIFLDLVGEY
jgi:3-methyl-2-oxobutanoate hydroxymethyltransferase